MALIDEKKDQVFLCRYRAENLIFSYQNQKIEMDPSNIMSIEKLDHYEYNIRTILKLRLRMDIRRKLWIMKHKREITVKFELVKLGQSKEVEEMLCGPETCWNMDFSLRLNDDDEATDTAALFGSMEMNEGDDFREEELEKEDYYASQNLVDIYLFNDKLLKASMRKYNEVITSGSIQNIIGRILTKTGHKKILMSRVENNKSYQEVLIPYHEAYKCLAYLDQYYGIYKKGSIIYYDLDKLYIINPNGKVTAKEKDEWVDTVFLITERNESVPGNGMVRKPNEKIFYINIPEENINVGVPSITKNDELGAAARIVVADGVSSGLMDSDSEFVGSKNEIIKYVREADNPYIGSMLTARMEENNCIVYINGDNFDINAFALNKTYKLVFDDDGKQKKYGKFKFRLSYAYHFIRHETEGYMVSSHRIILKKVSD